MDENKISKVLSILLGLLSVIAITGMLIQNKFAIETVFDAIVNFTQVAIPVLAVIIVSLNWKKPQDLYLAAGRQALCDLQKAYPRLLTGPRYHRKEYDPEKGKGLEYLFIGDSNKTDHTQRARFIPVQPLEEGVLCIYIKKTTLTLALDKKVPTDNEIQEIQKAVYSSVLDIIKTKCLNQYEILPNKTDTAIIIDFNENVMRKKKYYKIIFNCAKTALLVITNQLKTS